MLPFILLLLLLLSEKIDVLSVPESSLHYVRIWVFTLIGVVAGSDVKRFGVCFSFLQLMLSKQ